MPSTFHNTVKASWRASVAQSHGAAVTLVSGCGLYEARFDCATRCAQILGNSGLSDTGDGIMTESIPFYRIPIDRMSDALNKLTQQCSVALVENNGERYCLIYKIPRQGVTTPSLKPISSPVETISSDVTDY